MTFTSRERINVLYRRTDPLAQLVLPTHLEPDILRTRGGRYVQKPAFG